MAFLAGLPGGPILLAIWSFVTSRVGLALIAAVIAYTAGYSASDRAADLARKDAEIKTLQADQTTSEAARTLAERQSEALDGQLKTNQARLDALAQDLERRRRQPPEVRIVTKTITKTVPAKTGPATPARDCGLSSADAQRLKEIQ